MFEKSKSIIKVPTDKSEFGFDAVLDFKDDKLGTQSVPVCIYNSRDRLLEASDDIVYKLKTKLCQNPLKCETLESLNEFDDEDVVFEINAKGSKIVKERDHLKEGI